MNFITRSFGTQTFTYSSQLSADELKEQAREFCKRDFYNDDEIKGETEWEGNFSFRIKPVFFKRTNHYAKLLLDVLPTSDAYNVKLSVFPTTDAYISAMGPFLFGVIMLLINFTNLFYNTYVLLFSIALLTIIPLGTIYEINTGKKQLLVKIANLFKLSGPL